MAKLSDPSSYEEVYCEECAGSGEGMHEGSTCRACRGSGVQYVLVEDEEEEEEETES